MSQLANFLPSQASAATATTATRPDEPGVGHRARKNRRLVRSRLIRDDEITLRCGSRRCAEGTMASEIQCFGKEICMLPRDRLTVYCWRAKIK